jgi:hypothetical protein
MFLVISGCQTTAAKRCGRCIQRPVLSCLRFAISEMPLDAHVRQGRACSFSVVAIQPALHALAAPDVFNDTRERPPYVFQSNMHGFPLHLTEPYQRRLLPDCEPVHVSVNIFLRSRATWCVSRAWLRGPCRKLSDQYILGCNPPRQQVLRRSSAVFLPGPAYSTGQTWAPAGPI